MLPATALCKPYPSALIYRMKPNDLNGNNLAANLHLVLLALCVVYASVSATVWFASCELSDRYQLGIDRLHLIFNPAWGWLGMFVVSLCFWRAWAIRQLMYSLWALAASCCFAFILLQIGSSRSHQFGPTGDVYETVIRSILQPSLSNGSVGLLICGVTVIVNCALVLSWLGLFATGQSQTAWLRAKIFELAFVLPTAIFLGFFSLNSQQLWTVLIIGLVLGIFGAPIVYLAVCAAIAAPQVRFPVMIAGALIAAIPTLLYGGALTVIISIPIVLICAIVGASYITTKRRAPTQVCCE